jgi:hypothetical protein
VIKPRNESAELFVLGHRVPQSFPSKLDTTGKLDSSPITFSGSFSLRIYDCDILPLHASAAGDILIKSITRIGGYKVDNKRDM